MKIVTIDNECYFYEISKYSLDCSFKVKFFKGNNSFFYDFNKEAIEKLKDPYQDLDNKDFYDLLHKGITSNKKDGVDVKYFMIEIKGLKNLTLKLEIQRKEEKLIFVIPFSREDQDKVTKIVEELEEKQVRSLDYKDNSVFEITKKKPIAIFQSKENNIWRNFFLDDYLIKKGFNYLRIRCETENDFVGCYLGIYNPKEIDLKKKKEEGEAITYLGSSSIPSSKAISLETFERVENSQTNKFIEYPNKKKLIIEVFFDLNEEKNSYFSLFLNFKHFGYVFKDLKPPLLFGITSFYTNQKFTIEKIFTNKTI